MQDKLKKCFAEGKRGGERHQGLRNVAIMQENIQNHLAKALHNFEAMANFHNQGFSDWSASAAFYTL